MMLSRHDHNRFEGRGRWRNHEQRRPGGQAGGDPFWDFVVLLLGFEGADGSTTVIDQSSRNNPVACLGTTQIDTSWSMFGVGSGQTDGADPSGFQCGNAGDADFATANSTTPYCIEFFVRFISVAGDQGLYGTWFSPVTGQLLRMTAGSLDWFNFAGTNFSYATWNPVVDTPYYVVYDFDGARSRLFTDGVFRAGATAAQAFTAAVVGLGIGSQSGGGRPSNCRFDEVRVTNGMSRYGADANIPVPTAPFPRG